MSGNEDTYTQCFVLRHAGEETNLHLLSQSHLDNCSHAVCVCVCVCLCVCLAVGLLIMELFMCLPGLGILQLELLSCSSAAGNPRKNEQCVPIATR